MEPLMEELAKPVILNPGRFSLWGQGIPGSWSLDESGALSTWVIREINGVTMGEHQGCCATIAGPEGQVAEGLAAAGEHAVLLALIDALHDAERQAVEENTAAPIWDFDGLADLVAGDAE